MIAAAASSFRATPPVKAFPRLAIGSLERAPVLSPDVQRDVVGRRGRPGVRK